MLSPGGIQLAIYKSLRWSSTHSIGASSPSTWTPFASHKISNSTVNGQFQKTLKLSQWPIGIVFAGHGPSQRTSNVQHCLFIWLDRAANPIAHHHTDRKPDNFADTPSLSAKPSVPRAHTHAHVRAPIYASVWVGRAAKCEPVILSAIRLHCVRHTVWASTSHNHHSHSHSHRTKETSHPHTVARCFKSFVGIVLFVISFSTHTNHPIPVYTNTIHHQSVVFRGIEHIVRHFEVRASHSEFSFCWKFIYADDWKSVINCVSGRHYISRK